MKKSLIALAVAATAGTAFAQSSAVTLYGRAHAGWDNWAATGSTAGPTGDFRSRNRVYDSGSRVGLRGSENLGGGLRAGFVIETGLNLDNASEGAAAASATTALGSVGQSGGHNSGTGFLGSREAHVGLGNDSAELRFGRQNVYWGNGAVEDVAANHMIFGGIGTYTAASAGYVTAPAARLENTIKVILNKNLAGPFAGSELYVGFLNVAERAAANTDAKGQATGATIKYGAGPLTAQLDVVAVKDSAGNPASTSNRNNDGLKIGVGYQILKSTKASVHYYDMKRAYTDATTNTAALGASAGGGSQSGMGVGVIHSVSSAVALYAQYARLGDFKHTSLGTQANTSSNSVGLGVRYNLSPRTHVYTSYSNVTNAANSFVNMAGGGYSSAAAIGAGADMRSVTLGVLHNF